MGQTPQPEQPVYIYLFWGEGCPHCAKAKPFLESWPQNIQGYFEEFEIYHDEKPGSFDSLAQNSV